MHAFNLPLSLPIALLATLLIASISAQDSNTLDFKDYTLDSKSSSCHDVNIDMSTPGVVGLIHSPDSGTACKWTLTATTPVHIHLTFVDYNKRPPTNRTFFSLQSNAQLWLNINNNTNKSSTNSRFNLNANRLDDSFDLKRFTDLESVTDQLTIEYQSSPQVQFLILIRNEEASGEELTCNVSYELLNSSYRHSSRVPKSLLCQCGGGDCEYLTEFYAPRATEQPEQQYSCSYYAGLDTACKEETGIVQAGLGAERVVHREVRPGPNVMSFLSSIGDQCGSLVFGNEYGWISSPNFASSASYEAGLDCFYTISLQPNQIVQLRFKSFLFNPEMVNFVETGAYEERSASEVRGNESVEDEGASLIPTSNSLRNLFRTAEMKSSLLFGEDFLKVQPYNLGTTFDYDYLNIYDGPSSDSPLIAHLTSALNNFEQHFTARVFNSKSNRLFLRFHTAPARRNPPLPASRSQPHQGFNLTYQIKGLCIEDQQSCNSLYELNCFSPNQTCNDVWDCHNGADERGCGPCKPDQFRCNNHIFCYRLEDRCDGDHQCIDKSDELNCNAWFCNSKNGTYLCDNGQCVYEQWVCDGTNDCIDGSDERNCPTPFTRRVITTAVLGGTLCSLLLVMALGCACKLYTLHTVGYRNNIRLSQTVQSAAAAAAAAPLLATSAPQIPTIAEPASHNAPATSFTNNFTSLFRRPFLGPTSSPASTTTATNTTNTTSTSTDPTEAHTTATASLQSSAANSAAAAAGYQFNFNGSNNNGLQPGELPLPHHLIAPPTYNQTMGLVDEYEQRQLAFIEHVRSILQQQQQQSTASGSSAGLSLINLTSGGTGSNALSAFQLIPTVTTSSTTVHRVSSSSRRSNRHHHRHHYHNSSRPAAVANDTDSAASTGNNAEHGRPDHHTSGLVSGVVTGSASSRSHTRPHRHHRLHASTAQARLQPNIHHHITNNLTQVNFDANRRGLILQQQRDAESSLTSSRARPSTQQEAAATSTNAAPGSLTSTLTAMSAKTTSANIRDKIAKLIKDIVVHHGDNIQYVQLADQLHRSNTGGLQSASEDGACSSQATHDSESQSQETRIDNDLERSTGGIVREAENPTTTSSSNENNNNSSRSEDDVPLIE